jgi:hypothetical protein
MQVAGTYMDREIERWNRLLNICIYIWIGITRARRSDIGSKCWYLSNYCLDKKN